MSRIGKMPITIPEGVIVTVDKSNYVTVKGQKNEIGKQIDPDIVITQEEGVIARWYMGDIIIAATELFSLHPVKAFKSILPGNCDTYDDIHLDDLGAFAGEITGYLSSFVKSKSLNPEKEGMLG